MRLAGKVAIVTGAGGGIGQATCIKFAKEGAKVVAADISLERAQETINLVREGGGEGVAARVDVRDSESIATMVQGVVGQYGRVDVLVNNAGIVKDSTLKNMTEEQFDDVIEINLKGVYNCAKGVIETMLAQGSGVILNTSSVVGLYGNFGQTNYVATKAGIIGMTRTWARELGRYKIRVNAVAPGFVATEILRSMPQKILDSMVEHTPLGRMGQPEDVANAYCWLASDQASFVTGHCLSVDGGVVVGT